MTIEQEFKHYLCVAEAVLFKQYTFIKRVGGPEWWVKGNGRAGIMRRKSRRLFHIAKDRGMETIASFIDRAGYYVSIDKKDYTATQLNAALADLKSKFLIAKNDFITFDWSNYANGETGQADT